jgi:uncharacterized Zn-finger protein
MHCSLCNSGFDSEASLVEHYENAHDSGNMEQEESVHDGEVLEPEIDINEIDSDLIPTIINEHNNEQEHPIDQKDDFLKQIPGNEKGHILVCTLCSSNFDSEAILVDHYESAHKRYLCTVCKNLYTRRDNLKAHIDKSHSGMSSYKCSLCEDFSCAAKSDLKRHVEDIHNTEKGWLCTMCNCTYNRKDNLKSHVDSVHRGKKKFFCEICNAGFLRSLHLQSHIASVHEGKKGSNIKEEQFAFKEETPVDEEESFLGHEIP